MELLSDEDGSVATRYDSYGQKRTFDDTFHGVIRDASVVRDAVVEAVYEGVDPEGHAAEIPADLA